MEEFIGRSIDRYQDLTLLIQKSWGKIYQAHDPESNRTIAILVISARSAEKNNLGEYIFQSARAILGWKYPSLVRYYDLGKKQTLIYIIREYIPGLSLAGILKTLRKQERWLSLSNSIELAIQLYQAIDYAHQRGILHGELNPANIFFKPSQGLYGSFIPVITDLGLIKPGLPLPVITSSPYLSPETIQGRRVDKFIDYYALGAILHELITGQTPVYYTSDVSTSVDKASPLIAGLTPPRLLHPDLPEAFENILLVSLDRNNLLQDLSSIILELKHLEPDTKQIFTPPPGFQTNISLSELIQSTGSESYPITPQTYLIRKAPSQEMKIITSDQIHILEPDQKVRSISITPGDYSIGRSTDNYIAIDQPGVSRHHAQVVFRDDRYLVVDLNSTNGTYLEGIRLEQNKQYPWQPGENLRIGEVWLRLERSEQNQTTQLVPAAGVTTSTISEDHSAATVLSSAPQYSFANGSIIDPSLVILSSGRQWLGGYINPDNFSIAPGQSLSGMIVLFNRGQQSNLLELKTIGLPEEWILNLPRRVSIPAGRQLELPFTIRPPRSSFGRAGNYSAMVRITSQNLADQIIELHYSVKITANTQFSSELKPDPLDSKQLGQVFIHNRGSLTEEYTLLWEDKLHELAFEPPRLTVKIPAGKSAVVEFRPSLLRPRWFGGKTVFNYSLHVSSSSGQIQSHPGDFMSNALIPPWAPVATLVLITLIVCVLLMFINQLTAPSRYAQQTAQSDRTSLAQVDLQTLMASTATSYSIVNANQATILASTATAIWNSNDDDQDGLPNSEELKIGTKTDTADTDLDSLNDGDEIINYKTNPLEQDTDKDGLIDGIEIQKGTNPLKKDTDNDRLEDSIDPDPLNAPTSTLFIPPTATRQPIAPIFPTPFVPTQVPPFQTIIAPTPTSFVPIFTLVKPTFTPAPTIPAPPVIVNLAVNLDNAQASSIPGTEIIYTLQALNKSLIPVNDIQVKTNFPLNLENVNWGCSAVGGSKCSVNNGTGNINARVNLAGSGSAIFMISAWLKPNSTGTLVNTAIITGPQGVSEPITSDNQSTDTDILTPKASLSVSIADGRDSIFPGQLTSYTILVSNYGPSSVSGIQVEGDFPEQLGNISWKCSSTDGECNSTLQSIGGLDSQVDLHPGGTATFNIEAKVLENALGIIESSVSISSPVEPAINNLSSKDSTIIIPQADLALRGYSPTSVEAGSQITHTLTITNSGPSFSSPVTLTVLLPEDVSGIKKDTKNFTCRLNTNTITCVTDKLDPNQVVTLESVFKAPTTPGKVIIIYDVKGSEMDPNPINNTQTITFQVK